MCALEINRLRLQNLTFQAIEKENTKLVIFRNDRKELPHLTISFGNSSGEIDIHLTIETAGAEKHYESVGKIREEDFIKALESAAQIQLNAVSKSLHTIVRVKPEWLIKKRYAISYFDQDEENFLNEIALERKHHGKRERFVSKSRVEEFVTSKEIRESIKSPLYLNDLAAIEYNKPVYAVRPASKKQQSRIIPLILRPINNRLYWFRLDKFIMVLNNLVRDQMPIFFKTLLPEERWKLIYDRLQLKELRVEE